jgi:hypothetical protein
MLCLLPAERVICARSKARCDADYLLFQTEYRLNSKVFYDF